MTPELQRITDVAGRSLQLTWNGGKLIKIVDDLTSPRREFQYVYDERDNLIQVDNPSGSLTYTYGPSHELTSVTDENGNPVVLHYLSQARAVSKIVSCVGEQVFQYEGSTGKTYVIENGDNTTTFEYDVDGRLLRKFGNCCGFDLSYTYDEDNNIEQITDGRGNSLEMSYDSLGNMVLLQDPEGAEMTLTYEPDFNRLTHMKDRGNSSTQFTYDNKGNLTQINRPLDISESFTYNNQGFLTRICRWKWRKLLSFPTIQMETLFERSYPLKSRNLLL